MELITLTIALLVGLIMGLTGAGGSILTVPVFTYLLKLDVVTATTYSLFVVGTTSVAGAYKNYRVGNIDLKPALTFAVPSLIMVTITRGLIVPLIPEVIIDFDYLIILRQNLMMGLFAVLIIYAGVKMVGNGGKKGVTPDETESRKKLKLIIQGAVLGSIMGFLGAGGGFMIVPVLVLFAGMEMKKAIGTSLLLISVNALSGFFAGWGALNGIDWILLIKFSALMIAGILIGGHYASKLNPVLLKKGFGYFILAVAVYIVLKEFFI